MSVHTPNAQVSEAFAELQEYVEPHDLRVVDGTWGELGYGHYIVDQTKKCWLVIGRAMGWTRLQDVTGAVVSIPPRPDETTVQLVAMPHDQAVLLVKKCLGGAVLRDNFTQARQLLVAERWAVDLMPATGGKPAERKLRDHLDWFHASQWTGDIKGAEALARAHEELHASIADLPMSKPHHHTLNPGGNR